MNSMEPSVQHGLEYYQEIVKQKLSIDRFSEPISRMNEKKDAILLQLTAIAAARVTALGVIEEENAALPFIPEGGLQENPGVLMNPIALTPRFLQAVRLVTELDELDGILRTKFQTIVLYSVELMRAQETRKANIERALTAIRSKIC